MDNEKLSIIIPARNEVYLEKTLRSILDSAEGEIEIFAMLDGWAPDPVIDIGDDRVKFVHYKESIGQRKCINEGARMSSGKYFLKTDAHSMFDKGFDTKLKADCDYDWTVIPRMYNLDVSQWAPKRHKRTDYMYISNETGKELRAMYYSGFKNKCAKAHEEIDDVMTGQGACWFMHMDRFWELGGMDEGHGSWGQVGVEVACKAWLSGGRLVVNKKTWFSHYFRGGSGPGFPYKISGSQVEFARNYSRNLWINNKWPQQKRDFNWLIEKFDPPYWKDRDLTILFYSANRISDKILAPVVRSLKKKGIPIVSCTHEKMDLGNNSVFPKNKRSLQNIYRQVLDCARRAKTKYVALCEDDCLYDRDHFSYRPKKPFGYNTNRWVLHLDEKVYSKRIRPILSQCIAHRETLIKNLEERFKLKHIPDKYCGEMGCFEKQLGMTEYEYETFENKIPNLIVAHGKNTMGRKYVANQPCTNIDHWGPIDYWLKKFGPYKKEDSLTKKIRQWGYIASKIVDVEEMYENRDAFCDPRKTGSLKWFKECFPPYLKSIMNGIEFTDEELEKLPYFEYLKSKLHPVDRKPKLTRKGKRHAINLMKDVRKLYDDIKANGLRNPLDVWREGENLVLNRGGRRLEIIHALGYKTVPLRVFKDKEAYRLHIPDKRIVEEDTINCHAMHQFMKMQDKATDKYWVHGYTRLYDKHIGSLRNKLEKVLEIGVFRGASLLLWKKCFPMATIYGVDKDLKRSHGFLDGQSRIETMEGRQEDLGFLKNTVIPKGKFDLIIDDGGHKPDQMQSSFKALWDSLEHKGWYVIEDLFGNYRWGRRENNTMKMLQDLTDDMNLRSTIKSMHFYYNICFIEKM